MNEINQAITDADNRNQAATVVLLAERWLQENPNDVWISHEYATMLYKLTRFEEALQVYRDMIERHPDHRWGIYNQMGHLFRYRGDYKEAAKWYQKAIDEDPAEASSYIFLGATQARQGCLTEAESTHRKATQCEDGFIDEAYHNLGLVLRGQGRYEEAEVCFMKAVEIDPEYEDAIEALEGIKCVRKLIGRTEK